MEHANYRKYPRKYKKRVEKETEKSLSFSLGAAAGILAFTFLNGFGLGYLVKKRLR